MTPGALGNWENGRRLPRGACLARLLDALETPPRLRARLLALADPRFARVELAGDPLGAPVHVGSFLRSLRLRRDLGQTEVARALGVSQSTIARWETGDDEPDAARLHAALHALGASAEEVAAVVSGGTAAPRDFEARFHGLADLPHALTETMSLGLERDLWWRATDDPRAEALLVRTMAWRANWYGTEERADEVAALTRQALRLADDPTRRIWTTSAVLTHAQIGLRQGIDPRRVAREVGAWAEGLSHPASRAWAHSMQAIALATAGEDRAVPLAQASIALGGEYGPIEAMFRRVDLARVHLALGEPELALEAFGDEDSRFVHWRMSHGAPPWGLATRALALMGAGCEPEPDLLPALRGFVARTGIPIYARELREVERAHARFTRRSHPSS